MFFILILYNSIIQTLSPSSFLKENLEHYRSDNILTSIPSPHHFYRDGLLYFLESTSDQDYDNRVKKWCLRFDIPQNFDHQWTSLWYGKDENIIPFEDIKRRWHETYNFEDSLGIFNEMRTRQTEALSQYIHSHSDDPNTDSSASYESCLRHFFASSSIEDYNQRLEQYCQNFQVSQSILSTACFRQENYDISTLIQELHHEWKKVIGTPFSLPDHIDSERSRSIETLLMFGFLSCTSFDTEPLKKEVLKNINATQQHSYRPLASLHDQTKDILEQRGFISEGLWNERQLYLMTASQKTDLSQSCDPHLIDSLYAQSFFYLLRELAKRGCPDTASFDTRERFISELEIYMVELYLGQEDAFLQEKSHNTLSFLNISSLPHYEDYLESVHHFYQKMKRLKPQLEALAHKENSYRTEEEIQELWTHLLENQGGLCPAGSIERPLFYLEEFYDWSNISSESDMFFAMLQHYYAYLTESISGLEVFLTTDMIPSNEAHARIRTHNILNQGSYGYLSEVDTQNRDIYALSRGEGSHRDIQTHFSSLFTPFHFGDYVLKLFQDKRFFKIFAQLKKAQLKEGVFIDVFYQAFRLDRLILCLGEGFISFNPPEILKKQLWIATIRAHQFSQLIPLLQDLSEDERKTYWRETIGIRKTCLEYVLMEAEEQDIPLLQAEMKREINALSIQDKNILCEHALSHQSPATLKRLISIWGQDNFLDVINKKPTGFLYKCLRYGSLSTLEYFLSLNIDFQKDQPRFIPIIKSCLPQGRMGLELFIHLIQHSVIPPPKEEDCFMPDGKSILSYIIISLKAEKSIPFLEYFIKILKISPTLTDKDKFAFTPLHCACRRGDLTLVKYFIEQLKIFPNYCDEGYQSALSQAVIFGHLDILQYLVNQGADPTLADKNHAALTPFFWACLRGHMSIVKYFIEDMKVDPNHCQVGEETALSYATRENHLHIVQYLIHQGADPTLADKDDNPLTPLHWACRNGHMSIVKYFIEYMKVDPDDYDKRYSSAITQAIISGHLDIVQYLISHGASLAVSNPIKNMDSPLFTWLASMDTSH